MTFTSRAGCLKGSGCFLPQIKLNLLQKGLRKDKQSHYLKNLLIYVGVTFCLCFPHTEKKKKHKF